MKLNNQVEKAFQEAVQVINNAYSPYSKLKVAAALKFKGHDELYVGVNVENVSYGATICAERSAMVTAQSQKGGALELEFAVVISDIEGEPIPPCGMCLQVLSEFAKSDFSVYLGGLDGLAQESLFSEFLPQSFKKNRLISE